MNQHEQNDCHDNSNSSSGSHFTAQTSTQTNDQIGNDLVGYVPLSRHDQGRLQISEARLREAQAIARLGSFHWDATTNNVTWSDQLYRFYGKDPSAFVPSFENYLACVHPEFRTNVMDGLQKAIATKGEFDHEYQALRHDNQLCWVHARGRAIVGEAGEFLGLEGTCQDITERKTSETKIEEALSRLGKIANRIPGMVYEFRLRSDNRMSFPYASENMKTIFQVAHEEVEGDASKIFDCIHPEDLEKIMASIQTSAKEMTLWNQEFRLLLADGTQRWVSGSSSPTKEQDGSILWHGYLADISDRKQVEAALIRNREDLLEAQRIAHMGNWFLDLKTNQVTWSEQLFEILGYDATLPPPPFAEQHKLFSPDSRQRLNAAVQNAVELGIPYELELEVNSSPGVGRWIWVRGEALRDSRGDIVGIRGVAQDITERKHSEQKLIDAHAAAESANLAKSAFLANMSHEIRTPLTAILGFAELLGENDSSDRASEQRAEIFKTIQRAGNHLLTIINDILDLSKIEANKMTVVKTQFSLLDLLSEVQTLLSPVAAGKGVKVQVSFTGPVPDQILSDSTRLRQILLNLVGNSTKFTEAGRIDIKTGITHKEDRDWLVIDVEDTGRGMTIEQVARLFSPFGQGDMSSTRVHGGTGLGLSLSRRFAVLMGGSVDLLSTEPGKGSVFRLTLPLEQFSGRLTETLDQSNLAVVGLDAGVQTTASKIVIWGRILLAEDGIDNQRLIKHLLQTAGASVQTADNGRIALELIDQANEENRPFDLLVSDMQMPEMDGYTLAKTLRERGSNLPILALTANAMDEDREKCIQAGCNDYTTKPIDRSAFLTKCLEWLRGAE